MKIISSKSNLVICICMCIFCLYNAILSLVLSIIYAGGFLVSVVFFLFFFFMLYYLNRAACIIWVEDGFVKRKGLFRGFYKECPIADIRTVLIKHNPAWRAGITPYIYLIDDDTEEYANFYPLRKDGYIAFKKTTDNLEFLQSFWKREVEQ